MKKEEILKEAIKKAIKNGYNTINPSPKNNIWEYYPIIFSHDFAKAFFNKKEKTYDLICQCGCEYNYFKEPELQMYYCSQCGKKLKKVLREEYGEWPGHLRAMVLEENPITYLEKYL